MQNTQLKKSRGSEKYIDNECIPEKVLSLEEILTKKDYTPKHWELIERILVFCDNSMYVIRDESRYQEAIELTGDLDTNFIKIYEVQIFEEQKETGKVRKDINSHLIATMFLALRDGLTNVLS